MEKIAGQIEFLREHDVLHECNVSYKDEISVTKTYFHEMGKRVYTALQRYSNVHRGAGHNSMVTTELFEGARDTVLEYFGLEKRNHIVVFGNTARLKSLKCMLKDTNSIYQIFSNDIGLPIGVGALVVRRTALSKGIPFPRGGGVVKLVSRNFVIWEDVPARIEAGTPNIIGVITLAVALKLILVGGNENIFQIKTASDSANTILYNDPLSGCSGKELLSKLRETPIGGAALVPTLKGWVPYVNLDNAASSPTFEAIWDVVRLTWRQSDQVLKDIIEEVKKICARFFHAPEDQYELIFTQNTTEGINIVAEDLKNSVNKDRDNQPIVLNTLLEHNSNELVWRYIPEVCLLRFPVNEEGFLDLDKLERILCDYNYRKYYGRKRIELVAISGCSNVIGTLNDMERISIIAHKYGARILVDAAQLAAHRAIDMKKANIDYIVFSGHKMYAPFGVGG